ncbi:MAG: DNA polymerase III subunit delta' [Methylotenera sp.]|nr:DNA polymerase III subunit delta' [Methylotenera sp.]MDP1755523.1 DNA polymerase III subunit delta' [Methylotenera sp.]MDP1958250.1 DNA polymerase III subunit delta' [Methylotenera sp.]MDP3943494.1 DNA polymerase III subunit delta' [Methylotenera sp.]
MSNIENIYPWQSDIWQRLNKDGQRLPHALLLHGRAGIGKYDFARHFSQALLCANKSVDGKSCGLCSSCNWFNDESHPDFRLLSPEQESESEEDGTSAKKTKKKTQISVTQVRELSDFLSLSSHRSNGLRIVLIHPAEALNLASANALLKVLEEPADGVVFILVSHQMQRLLPTIISRCHKINMPVPDEKQSLTWLNAQGVDHAQQQLAYLEGSPIKVFVEQAQFKQRTETWRLLSLGHKLEPHIAAPALIANSVETGIIAIQKWIYDIVAIKLGQQTRYHLQYVNALQALAEKVNLSRLFEMQKKTNEYRKLALHPLNHELQMEGLLLEYTKIFQS